MSDKTMIEEMEGWDREVREAFKPLVESALNAETADEAFEAMDVFLTEYNGYLAAIAGLMRDLYADARTTSDEVRGRIEDVHAATTSMIFNLQKISGYAKRVRWDRQAQRERNKKPQLKVVESTEGDN